MALKAQPLRRVLQQVHEAQLSARRVVPKRLFVRKEALTQPAFQAHFGDTVGARDELPAFVL